MKFEKAEPTRAYHSIVDQVCDAIMSGDLHEGDLLPPEREMATQTGICRASVREALKVLADAGLIAMKPGGGGGTRVIREVIPSELLGQAIEISRKRLLDLFEVRNSLELTAAEIAAARASTHQIQALEEIVARMEVLVRDCPEDGETFRTLDLRFHFMVMKATGNDMLVSTYNAFTRQIALAFEMVSPHDVETAALPTMQAVVLAIKHRNPPEARIAMATHVYPLIPIVERFFEENPSEQSRLRTYPTN